MHEQYNKFLSAVICGDYETASATLIGCPLYAIYHNHLVFRRAAEHGKTEIVKLLLALPSGANAIKADNYIAFQVAAANGRIDVLKILLAAAEDADVMISGDDFCGFREAVRRGNIATVDFLISICSRHLLRKMIMARDAIELAATHPDVIALIYLASVDLWSRYDISILPQSIRATYWRITLYCTDLSAAHNVDASPMTILRTLDSGRDLLGWVLAARHADIVLTLPSEIVNVIFAQIDPRWCKIIAAMRRRYVPAYIDGTSDWGSRANNLLGRTRFLHEVL